MRWPFGDFFALVGRAMLVVATVTLITASDSRTWPQIQGMMLVSEYERESRGRGQ